MEELSIKKLQQAIKHHFFSCRRLDRLDNYYRGEQKILSRQHSYKNSPNHRIVHNFGKYISDTICGYLFGTPLRLQNTDEKVVELLKQMGAETHDAELSKDLSVFGCGYEKISIHNGNLLIELIDPRNICMIFQEENENVMEYAVEINRRKRHMELFVWDCNAKHQYIMKDMHSMPYFIGSFPHQLNCIPIIFYQNNEEKMGDFETVIHLIDAYDNLQSDRLNDKERFVNAVLVIKNASLPDDDNIKEKLRSGILEIPGYGENQADCSYLTKTLNESQTEILRKSIAKDIHKFSFTPDFTDENFAGMSSGVAMKYKLLSLEYLAKIKERFFVRSYQRRLECIKRYFELTGRTVDVSKTSISFGRSVPVDELNKAKQLHLLKDVMDQKALEQLF